MKIKLLSHNVLVILLLGTTAITEIGKKCVKDNPSNCVDLLQRGVTTSGIYNIYPWYGKYNMSVFCDMETDGGGWIVFQRRNKYEKQLNFFRDWENYSEGFGNLDKEFWLGNHYLHILTNQDYVTLRVDLEDFEGTKRYAVYKEFQIADCQDRYRLKIGKYYGDSGDSLEYHNNATFITYDDGDVGSCARGGKGGWWYVSCSRSNLNGLYLSGNTTLNSQGVFWALFRGYKYSLKKSEMKIRPLRFSSCTTSN